MQRSLTTQLEVDEQIVLDIINWSKPIPDGLLKCLPSLLYELLDLRKQKASFAEEKDRLITALRVTCSLTPEGITAPHVAEWLNPSASGTIRFPFWKRIGLLRKSPSVHKLNIPACELDISEPCGRHGKLIGNHRFVDGHGGGKRCSQCSREWPY